MDSKKKKRISIIVTVAVLVVAIATLGIFYAVRNPNSNKNSGPAVNYTSSTIETNVYNEAIADGRVSNNYYGTYEYSAIKNICFNNKLTEADITTICENKGTNDVNGLLKYLSDRKYEEIGNARESIVLTNDGRYSKVRNGFAIEIGSYIGDDNLSLISLLDSNDENKYYLISLNYDERSSAVSVDDKTIKNNGTKVYIFEDFYSKEDPSLILFTITYEYKLIPVDEIKTFPDSMLDF